MQGILSRGILSLLIFRNHKIWGILSEGILSWGILSQGNFSLGDCVMGDYVLGDFVKGAFVTGDFDTGDFVLGDFVISIFQGYIFLHDFLLSSCGARRKFVISFLNIGKKCLKPIILIET